MSLNCKSSFPASLLLLLFISNLFFGGAAVASSAIYDEDPVKYSETPPHDAIAKLQAELQSGKAHLDYDDKLGFLPAVLKYLHIPVSSQMLVFSKTSLQTHFIAPETPRALYFNDNVYVGFVQKGKSLEIASTDPRQGAIFYTIDQQNTGKPKIERQTHKCLQCHDSSSMTLGVPGYVMRSVYPDAEGMPVYSAGTFHTTQESPYKERWGGWYVTGSHGSTQHMGNTSVKNREDAEHADFSKGWNLSSLQNRVDTSHYLTPNSDIVALMVAEHQTTMHNLITRAGMEMRVALRQEKEVNKALGEPADRRSPSTVSRLKSVADPLLKYMLFCDEAKLSDQVKGTSGFAEEFAAAGLKDTGGRSLRDFDLKTRLFKYPCSYLIYSDAFDSLPPIVLEYVTQRLGEILDGKDRSPGFAHLTPDDRDAIREILGATWKHAPKEWKK